VKTVFLLLALFLVACAAPDDPTPQPSEPSVHSAPTSSTEANASGRAPNEGEESGSGPETADSFVEPEPRPFAGGKPSWRQETWWQVRQLGEVPLVVYKVGELYGIAPMSRPLARPWLFPKPPEAWLLGRCKRCSHDANPDGRPNTGGPLSLGEGPESLSADAQERVAKDFRSAADQEHAQAKIKVDEDGWVWLHHTPEAHERVLAWLRRRTCGHRKAR
jgi:hypothetical protein